ncbi:hypothetical protein Tco_1186075 [Tanacetum coccineum]
MFVQRENLRLRHGLLGYEESQEDEKDLAKGQTMMTTTEVLRALSFRWSQVGLGIKKKLADAPIFASLDAASSVQSLLISDQQSFVSISSFQTSGRVDSWRWIRIGLKVAKAMLP